MPAAASSSNGTSSSIAASTSFVLHAGTRTLFFRFNTAMESQEWQQAITTAARGDKGGGAGAAAAAAAAENGNSASVQDGDDAIEAEREGDNAPLSLELLDTRVSERAALAQLLLSLRSSPEKLLGRPDLAFSCLVGGVERLRRRARSSSSSSSSPSKQRAQASEVLRDDFTAVAGQFFLPLCDAFSAGTVFDALTAGTTMTDQLGGGTIAVQGASSSSLSSRVGGSGGGSRGGQRRPHGRGGGGGGGRPQGRSRARGRGRAAERSGENAPRRTQSPCRLQSASTLFCVLGVSASGATAGVARHPCWGMSMELIACVGPCWRGGCG